MCFYIGCVYDPGGTLSEEALELRAKADGEGDDSVKAEWMNLALAYLRLAEQARLNARNDVVYEPPLPKQLPIAQQIQPIADEDKE